MEDKIYIIYFILYMRFILDSQGMEDSVCLSSTVKINFTSLSLKAWWVSSPGKQRSRSAEPIAARWGWVGLGRALWKGRDQEYQVVPTPCQVMWSWPNLAIES